LAVNVEIKVDGPDDWRSLAERVVEHLRSSPGDHLVTSFSAACVAGVRALAPEVPTGQLGFAQPDAATFVRTAASDGHTAINPWDGVVDAALVNAAHDAGLAVHVWTVDEPERMVELAALGVDGIITNRPDVMRSVLDRLRG
jgi:glycerophosphoryl diester phosphodiesterase